MKKGAILAEAQMAFLAIITIFALLFGSLGFADTKQKEFEEKTKQEILAKNCAMKLEEAIISTAIFSEQECANSVEKMEKELLHKNSAKIAIENGKKFLEVKTSEHYK